jgi:hypothetical protein
MIAAVLGIVAAISTVALATNPHFVGTPTCSVTSSGALSCSGKIAGLGGEPASSTITADVTATFVCRNHGGNIAPGQGTFTPGATSPSNPITVRNGNVLFSNTLQPPATPSPAQAGCPNGGWTVERTSLTYTNVVVHIFDVNNVEIFTGSIPGTFNG